MLYQIRCFSTKEISAATGLTTSLIKNVLAKNRTPFKNGPIPISQYKEFAAYTKKVRRLTTHVMRLHNMVSKKDYHWNHKFSIVDGFRNNVNPDFLAMRCNLELIPAKDNLSLGWRSKIDLSEFKNMMAATICS